MLVVDSLLIQDLRHHAHLHMFVLINFAVLVGGYGPLLLTRKGKLDRFAVFVDAVEGELARFIDVGVAICKSRGRALVTHEAEV